jgi:hypothetical protein
MLTEDRGKDADVAESQHNSENGASHTATVVNWVLALLSVVGAAGAVFFAYGLTLGTASCTDRSCPHLGMADYVFGPVIYGAPVVAVLAIAASFVTARKRRGWIVPAIAWFLLIVGPLLLLASTH